MFDKLFDGRFMPHGHCFLWREDLLFLHVGGDLLTALAYFVIPIGLVYLVRQRDDLAFNWIFVLFAAFIFWCGVTHLVDMVNVWHGFYYLEGVAKVITGLVSVVTAVMLWKLMPKALAIPSNRILEERNRELLDIRDQLEKSNQTLEMRVRERTMELEKLALIDSLTDVYNRGEIIRIAEDELHRLHRYPQPLSLLMLDVDNFKQINDRLGHQAGDEVLARVAQSIIHNCRETDRVGRYGGEEFIILSTCTERASALALAERIRSNIEQLDFPNYGRVTVSIGVAQALDGELLKALVHRADRALYQAKSHGRNRVFSESCLDTGC